ncbi:PAP2 dolichyldiphosphatase, putative [Giardia lamblia P15]|uniref:PAP2 dolichyldiphosphatase, putative n=1 Tax=Giardia intestinalis (strain P15) TaxID=658858 RepID=E1EXS6_GIAIA|nr:PAP2 dolichyldiphosphatase, putative [Giardia lamblia P15]
MVFSSNEYTFLHLVSQLYPMYTGLWIFCAWIYCSIQKVKPDKTLLTVGCVMLTNPIVSYTLKHLLHQPRPYSSDPGMPSAHAFWAAGLSAALLLAAYSQYGRSLSIGTVRLTTLRVYAYIVCLMAPLVAAERIYSKEHTIAQVAIGLLLGTLYTFLVWIPMKWLTNIITCILDSIISYMTKDKRRKAM